MTVFQCQSKQGVAGGGTEGRGGGAWKWKTTFFELFCSCCWCRVRQLVNSDLICKIKIKILLLLLLLLLLIIIIIIPPPPPPLFLLLLLQFLLAVVVK